MTTSAGFQLVAGRVPRERIATTEETSNSSASTNGTEVAVIEVTADLVSGRRYCVVVDATLSSDASERDVWVRIREDSLAGTVLQQRRVFVATATTLGYHWWLSFEYVASATGSKTFVGTIEESGATDVHLEGASNKVGYMYVEYVSG